MRRWRVALLAVGALVLPWTVSNAFAASSADDLLAKLGDCTQISAGQFATDEGEAPTIPVCGTKDSKTEPIFWSADMDIDCDGVPTDACNENTDDAFQPDTALHTSKDQPFQADKTRYFVIPQNEAEAFHFADAGIKLGDVAAIIRDGKVVFAVFADTGPTEIIGEASHATAEALDVDPNPNTGGVDSGVTYVVFPNSAPAVPEDNAAIDAAGQAALDAFLNS
jgi:hypothetical protein